jgi:hypothetical protein
MCKARATERETEVCRKLAKDGRNHDSNLCILSRVWVTIDGIGLVVRFVEHLQIVTTSNCSAIPNSHTLHALCFPVCCIFTGCRLATAFKAVAFSASVFTSLLVDDCLTTHYILVLTCIQHRSSDRTENTSPNSSYIFASRSCNKDRDENIASQLLHCCILQICCLATGVFAELFLSNVSFLLHSACLEQNATISFCIVYYLKAWRSRCA